MAEVSPDPIPTDLSAAFRSAVQLYSDWVPSSPEKQVRLGSKTYDMSALCDLIEGFRDPLPEDVSDKLMIYMKACRRSVLHSWRKCFLRLIEDRKRQG
jgi:hypothetical protein